MDSTELNVSEIFYSLQGEGIRAGQPTVFIRLQGCKAKHACAASGVVCDTEFESGRVMQLADIKLWIEGYASGCKWITWTGGEPTDQLTEEIVTYFYMLGYNQTIETSGLRAVPAPQLFALVSISPKVAEHIIAKNFTEDTWTGKRELRYVRHAGQNIPKPSIKADYYFVSPHSDGNNINPANLQHCVQLCLDNPAWSLSVQQHKQWRVL